MVACRNLNVARVKPEALTHICDSEIVIMKYNIGTSPYLER